MKLPHAKKINRKMELNTESHIIDLDVPRISNLSQVLSSLNWKLVEFAPILLANVIIHELTSIVKISDLDGKLRFENCIGRGSINEFFGKV